jgi:hypothetical protein
MPGMRARHGDSMEHFHSRPSQGGASSSGWHQEFEEMQGHPGRGAMGPSTRFPSQAALAPFLQVTHHLTCHGHPVSDLGVRSQSRGRMQLGDRGAVWEDHGGWGFALQERSRTSLRVELVRRPS